MNEICFTPYQVKLIRTTIYGLMGLTVFQALVTRRLTRDLKYVKHQYHNLHEAAHYLLTLMEENNIALGEFDLIALKTIMEERR